LPSFSRFWLARVRLGALKMKSGTLADHNLLTVIDACLFCFLRFTVTKQSYSNGLMLVAGPHALITTTVQLILVCLSLPLNWFPLQHF